MDKQDSKTPGLREAATLPAIPLLSTGKIQIRDFTLEDMQAYARAAVAASLALPDEPVAIIAVTPNGGATIGWMPGYIAKHNDKLYAAPQPAEPKAAPVEPLFGENDDR